MGKYIMCIYRHENEDFLMQYISTYTYMYVYIYFIMYIYTIHICVYYVNLDNKFKCG